MTTIADIYAALATIERTISGIYAFDNPPDTISGNTPCFVNFAQANQADMVSQGEDEQGIIVRNVRLFRCNLYVISTGGGAPGEKYGLLTPYFDTVEQAFLAHPAANLTQGTIWLKYLGDDGGVNLPYGNDSSPYTGISFRVQVEYLTKTAWATGE